MSEPYRDLKIVIDELLDVNSTIRKKRRSESDKKTELFVQIINTIEELNARSVISTYELGIDMNKYDEKFLEVIDAMLYISYGKECYELISFYLFNRMADDGSINPIHIQDTGEDVTLTNPYELYNLMKIINPNIE